MVTLYNQHPAQQEILLFLATCPQVVGDMYITQYQSMPVVEFED